MKLRLLKEVLQWDGHIDGELTGCYHWDVLELHHVSGAAEDYECLAGAEVVAAGVVRTARHHASDRGSRQAQLHNQQTIMISFSLHLNFNHCSAEYNYKSAEKILYSS